MTKFTVLGSAYSIPSDDSENTHLLVEEGGRLVLVDCSASPTVHMKKAGYNVSQLTDVILTHFHPDHVYGVPLLLMDLWLLGRKEGLRIHALSYVVENVKSMMDLFGWKDWPNFFPVEFHELAGTPGEDVLKWKDLSVRSTPVKHLIPTIGLRFDFSRIQRSVSYSCDTEPCDSFIELAKHSDVILHESAGEAKGHTSPAGAGKVATACESGYLYLIHYPPSADTDSMIAEARMNFSGPIKVAKDLMTIPLD